ncbi:MAG: cell surface protein SprA [Gemmatimonadaceae bacterium]
MIFRAVLKCLSLAVLTSVAKPVSAQVRPPVRDSLVAPVVVPEPLPFGVSADPSRMLRGPRLITGLRLKNQNDSLALRVPPILQLFGSANLLSRFSAASADEATRRMIIAVRTRVRAQWDSLLLHSAAAPQVATVFDSAPPLPIAPIPASLSRRERNALARAARNTKGDTLNPLANLLDVVPDLGIAVTATLEAKGQRSVNQRCTAVQVTVIGSNCTPNWTPNFDFQFGVRTSGVVADRIHLNVDYDSRREFDASNNISVRYQGKKDEALGEVEVGNITFQPAASRFLTSGIPSGNYGLQAKGQLGPMRYTAVVAQQKGNLSKDRTFTIGDKTSQQESRAFEDVGMELRRFFFTVDPRKLVGYPNIDILNRSQMQQAAAALPDSIRPVRVYVYRQLIGQTTPLNPRGPQFSVRGARNSSRQLYDLQQENKDYYIDPSGLWISLVKALTSNERLVVAYEVNVNGVPGRNPNTGGTPDIEFTAATQYANLLWEPELQPNDQNGYFQREIKSVYRLGGEEIKRESIALKIVTGTSGDQEKPQDQSRGQTYLQLFGMSQVTNAGAFDIENRVWPRPQDANQAVGTTQKLIRDNFVVFPSLQPFARAGLAQPLANPANDTLYLYPNEYLYSTQRPQSIFRMQASYLTEGTSSSSPLSLGSLQVRPFSERVLLDGVQLVRDVDYTASYEIGQITFKRGDTLFLRPRQVTVRFEENPTFNSSPTSILAFNSLFPLENGQVAFTAISQQQKSTYNRPPLGFEPTGSVVAGVTANFNWDARLLTQAINKLPIAPSSTPSRIGFNAEFAMSKPQPNAAGQAYVESFESSAGRDVSMSDGAWSLSSRPAAGSRLGSLFPSNPLTLDRVSSLAYQSVGLDQAGNPLQFTIDQIDPSVTLKGNGVKSPEQLLWLTLYPLSVGGVLDYVPGTNIRRNAWTVGPNTMLGPTPTGRRWASIHQVLNASGEDLSRIENIQFFALVSTNALKRRNNPTLILDFGDISENRVAFTPETLTVDVPSRAGLKPDTTYRGKRLAGYDRFDSERDKFSRTFNAVDNDVGIAGSIADTIIVVDHTKNGVPTLTEHVPICSSDLKDFLLIGDNKANCSIHNNRLDEEDIDLDGQLNLKDADTDREQWKRFAVNLADSTTWSRVGKCTSFVTDSATLVPDTLCWVQVRLNWRAPLDSLNSPTDRRMRALRLTMISSAFEQENAFSRVVLSKFQLIGAPWLRRGDRPLAGVAGDSVIQNSMSYVISSVIGTQDSSSTLHFQPPPGVVEATESKTQTSFDNSLVQINDHALRLQAGTPGQQFPVFSRAEAYYRFPEGNKSFMGYRSLRIWMRGRGNGWGTNGELNAYVKVGRDENNFYFYRTTADAGETVAAWSPELQVDLTRFQALRSQLENNSLRNSPDSLSCTGADLELIKRSGLPRGVVVRRYAVCKDGYIVYTSDPSITPPNLAGVQEMAVGFVRIDSLPHGGAAIQPSDTLELWVDDVRLTDVVDNIGFAAEVGLFANAGDLAEFRVNVSRRDPNFRQLGENPSFLTSTGLSAGTTIHLERMLPRSLGIVLPMTVAYGGTGVEQLFVNGTDVRADGIQGLRNPSDSRVDYSLAMRRAIPIVGRWYAPLVNGFTVSAIWGHGSSQSSFQESRNHNYAVTAALNVDGLGTDIDARNVRLPGVLDRFLNALPKALRESDAVRGLRSQQLRWRPSRFQLASSLAKVENNTTSFLKPAFLESDSGQAVQTLSNLWQNSAAIDFRPLHAITATFGARQLLDLRNYQDTPGSADSLNRGLAASAERLKVLGADVGLERERSLNSTIDFRPGLTSWLAPSFRFGGAFTLYKDPNARALLRQGDSVGNFRLPKRLGASQNIDAGVLFDVGRLLILHSRDTSALRSIGRNIQAVNIRWSRSLNSSYDNTVLDPGFGYQLGFGSVNTFRGLTLGQLASGAGRVGRLNADAGVRLPFSLTLTSRFEQSTSSTWTRRVLDNIQALITSENNSYPDVSLLWGFRFAHANKLLNGFQLNAGYKETETKLLVLNEAGQVADQSRQESQSYPIGGQISWAFIQNLITNFRYEVSTTKYTRPGSVTRDHPVNQSYEARLPIKLPTRWKTRGLNASFGYDRKDAITIVGDAPGLNGIIVGTGVPSILTNNGLRTYRLSGNTELSTTLGFTFTASHQITFDRNYNRQNALTILSLALNVTFGAGEIR